MCVGIFRAPPSRLLPMKNRIAPAMNAARPDRRDGHLFYPVWNSFPARHEFRHLPPMARPPPPAGRRNAAETARMPSGLKCFELDTAIYLQRFRAISLAGTKIPYRPPVRLWSGFHAPRAAAERHARGIGSAPGDAPSIRPMPMRNVIGGVQELPRKAEPRSRGARSRIIMKTIPMLPIPPQFLPRAQRGDRQESANRAYDVATREAEILRQALARARDLHEKARARLHEIRQQMEAAGCK